LFRSSLPLASAEPSRKPSWLKVKGTGWAELRRAQTMMRDLKLHTVCEKRHCPKIG